MSPARIRAENLTGAQRKALGVGGSRSRGSRGAGGWSPMRCAACNEVLEGQRAVEDHRDRLGHHRYAIVGWEISSSSHAEPAAPDP